MISDRLKKHKGMHGFDQAIPSIISVNELSAKKPRKKSQSPIKVSKREASPIKKAERSRIFLEDATPNKKTRLTAETEDLLTTERKEMATQITE